MRGSLNPIIFRFCQRNLIIKLNLILPNLTTYTGQHFWARGYFVSTVGTDEQTIREHIKRQETEDRRLDQLRMFEEDHL